MSLYKIKVDGAEFIHYSYWEFIVITASEEKAIEIIYKFVGSKSDDIPEYLNRKNLKIEKIADVTNVKNEYANEIISYVYQE